MAHGQPDFGAYAAKTIVGSLSDMAELAARLGSIVTFDRRGDVIDFDDFEGSTAKWNIVKSGDGAGAVISPKRARSGSFCFMLTSGMTLDHNVGIYRFLAYPVLSRMGLELSFGSPTNAGGWELVLHLRHDSVNYVALVVFTRATKELQIVYGDGDITLIDTLTDYPLMAYGFHTVKVVADFVTKKYVRLIIDDNFYDLSSYLLKVSAAAPLDFLSAVFIHTGDLIANKDLHLDDYILTQNEP